MIVRTKVVASMNWEVMKSNVANYTMRPRELEELCLYDFLCSYTVARRGQGSLLWCGDHPSKDRLAVKKLPDEKRRIPRVNFLDFIDTRFFQGEDIINYILPEVKESRHLAMEEFSKKASVLFIPFRDVHKDLMLYESFHLKLQQYVRDDRLPTKHLFLQIFKTAGTVRKTNGFSRTTHNRINRSSNKIRVGFAERK